MTFDLPAIADSLERLADVWHEPGHHFICHDLCNQAGISIANNGEDLPEVQYLAALGMPTSGAGFISEDDWDRMQNDKNAIHAYRHELRWVWLEFAAMLAREGFQP